MPWAILGVLLVLGLWLRVYLAGSPGYPFDLQCFYHWSDTAHRGNVGSPYHIERKTGFPCNYPPGYMLVLSRVPWLYELCTGETFRTLPDKQTRQIDEVDKTLHSVSRLRNVVKLQELLAHFREKAPSLYAAMTDAEAISQVTRKDRSRDDAMLDAKAIDQLTRMGLMSAKGREAMMLAMKRGDMKRYEGIRQGNAKQIRSLVEADLPYTVSDRLRSVAVWVKLPALLFDLAGAVVLFVLLRGRLGRVGGLAVGTIYLFLPAVIYDSACWGQVDAVHSLLMLVCLACLVAGHSFLVGLFFAVALLTKFQSIVIAPILAAALIRRWRDVWGEEPTPDRPEGNVRVAQSVGLVLLGVVVASAVILLPFAVSGSADDALNTYVKAPGSYSYVSVCAYNPWWLLNTKPDLPRWYFRYTERDDRPFIGPITPKHVGLLLFAAFSLWVMWMVYHRGCGYETIAAAGAVMTMGFFVLPTEIHERYGFPAMLMAAYLVGVSWRHLPALLALSVAQFYNLTTVQPVEDPRYSWLMPVANVFFGNGGITYVLVLIHVACLVYFTIVLYRLPVRHSAGRVRAEVAPGTVRSGGRNRRKRTGRG